VILTNPPFGGTEQPGIERNFPNEYRTRETADLFIALVLKRLKPGGRCAIVLPDGFLFGEGVKTRLKERLINDCDLHTIVRLPKGVFAPYTNINTNLLFFTKGGATDTVWYYEHPLPEGYKKYTKTKPIRFEEFESEMDWWANREEIEHAWKVSADTIREQDYNLDINNPHEADDGPGDPDKLLTQYHRLQEDVAATRQSLKEELKKIIADTLS